jgi:hypothetical protein
MSKYIGVAYGSEGLESPAEPGETIEEVQGAWNPEYLAAVSSHDSQTDYEIGIYEIETGEKVSHFDFAKGQWIAGTGR